jgi:hypothetical protein
LDIVVNGREPCAKFHGPIGAAVFYQYDFKAMTGLSKLMLNNPQGVLKKPDFIIDRQDNG